MITAEKQMQRAVDFLGAIPRAAETALARALNGAAKAGRESAISAIVARYAVHASDVRGKIALTTATPDRLGVEVIARSGPLSLTYFPHSPARAGTGGRGRSTLRAEVLRGQPKPVLGAFVATINGRPRVMFRTGGRTATGKTAIKSVPAVPIAVMLGVESVRTAVEQRSAAVLDTHLDREIDRALGRIA